VQDAPEVVERVTADRVTPVDDPRDAPVAGEDMPGAEVAVEQVAAFRAREQVPPVPDRRGRLAEQPGVDQAAFSEPTEVVGALGNGADPGPVLALQALRAGGEAAVALEHHPVHLPERLSRLDECERGAVSGLAGDFPEENAGHSGKVTRQIGGLDDRDRDPERSEHPKDSGFAPQVRAVGQFQERDGALAPDAEDLVAGEGRHFSGVHDRRAGEPGCEAAGFGRGQFSGDGGSSAERDSWFGNAY
jgi:hypothetical protein